MLFAGYQFEFFHIQFLGAIRFFSLYYSDRIYSIAPNRIFNKGNWFEIWIAWSELFMFEREKTWICSVHERFANIISTHNPSPSLSAPYFPFLCFLYTGFPFAWHRFTIALMLHPCIVWNNLQTQWSKPQPNYHKKSSQSHCRSLKQSYIKKVKIKMKTKVMWTAVNCFGFIFLPTEKRKKCAPNEFWHHNCLIQTAKRNISSWGQNWQNARHIKIQITLSMNAHLQCHIFWSNIYGNRTEADGKVSRFLISRCSINLHLTPEKNNINSINDKTFRLLAFAFLLLLFGCIAALSASWNIKIFSVLEVSFDDILNGQFNAHKFYIRLHNLPSSSTYLLGNKATKTTTCLKNKNIKRPNETRMNGKKTNTRKMCKCFQFLSRVSGRSANNSVGDQISGEYKRHHHFFKSLKTSFI